MQTMRKLTDAQRRQWASDGYFILEGALAPSEVALYTREVDALREKPGWEPMSKPLGHYGWVESAINADTEAFMDRRDLIGYHEAFIDLIDYAPVFDLVVDIMGPYICLSMTQAIVRASGDGFQGYTHTDGGEALRRLRVAESSRPIAMKAMYLLSDIDGPDCGNFTVFPGSHRRPFPEPGEPVLTPRTPGAVPLTGKAGDCILFSHALWHGPSPNLSGRARKTLLYNYCQMCVRQYDYPERASVPNRCSPRQRRLLGDLGYDFRPGSYFYAPVDQAEVIANGNV